MQKVEAVPKVILYLLANYSMEVGLNYNLNTSLTTCVVMVMVIHFQVHIKWAVGTMSGSAKVVLCYYYIASVCSPHGNRVQSRAAAACFLLSSKKLKL